MNREILLRAYAMIGDATPLRSDCGQICGAACCAPDEDGQGGVCLFPSEDAHDMSWGHADRCELGEMLVCDGMCDRNARPFACRIFPLTPVKRQDGQWSVRMDVRANAVCPLTRYGVRGLDPVFVRGVRNAIRVIAEDSEGEAFLERWAATEQAYHFTL